VAERRRALLELQVAVAEVAEEWVDIARRIKQLPTGSSLVGEEWISGPWAVLAYVGHLQETLRRIDAGEAILDGYHFEKAPGGRLSVPVLPHGTFDRLLLSGFSAEVWMRPGLTEAEVRRSVGLTQRDPGNTQGIALVLGAGNIFSIAPLDVLYMLFAENRVAVLKLNPITDPLHGVFTRIFEPFAKLGAVEVITGDVEIGSTLAYHPGVAAVHMTGSEATHDAIVWGPGEAGQVAKAGGTPCLLKPMTSELGGVSPVIVVPGRWSRADLRFQAQHVATQRLHNSGHNCVGTQIVIVSSDWAQKEAFLAELRTALAEAPARPVWYPGCDLRVSSARESHGSAEAVGGAPMRTLLTGLDLADGTETAFDTEYFGPILGVAELPGTGAGFLDAAVEVSNERLRGTLGANIVIHPKTAKELGGRLQGAIAELRYGTVAVNCWTAVGYLTAAATWGAFPGHTAEDIQSGTGVVHNALLLDGTERTVAYGPFRPAPRSLLNGELSLTPKPAWFVNNKTADTTGRKLTAFAAKPGWGRLASVFVSAIRG
jgi:acyl-CoA reductase-like NAD-dependent aldehyde dehydrogenase